MNNQRVPCRSLLCGKDLADRCFIIGIGSEPVHGFCRESDDTAGLQYGDCAFDLALLLVCQLRMTATFFARSRASSGVFPKQVTCPILRP